MLYYFCFFCKKLDYFKRLKWLSSSSSKSSFKFTEKMNRKYRDFPQDPSPPQSATSMRVVHLLQLMNLQWYNITIQSLQFTLEFTLGIVVSTTCFDKCMMPHIHHYSTVQNSLPVFKPLYACSIHASPDLALESRSFFSVSIALPSTYSFWINLSNSINYSTTAPPVITSQDGEGKKGKPSKNLETKWTSLWFMFCFIYFRLGVLKKTST